jgi:hypothetical protein
MEAPARRMITIEASDYELESLKMALIEMIIADTDRYRASGRRELRDSVLRCQYLLNQLPKK